MADARLDGVNAWATAWQGIAAAWQRLAAELGRDFDEGGTQLHHAAAAVFLDVAPKVHRTVKSKFVANASLTFVSEVKIVK